MAEPETGNSSIYVFYLSCFKKERYADEEKDQHVLAESQQSLDPGKLPAAIMHTSPSSYPWGILTDGLDWLFTVA